MFVNTYILHYITFVKFCFCIYFTIQSFRLFCNSVGFQFEKSIQVLKNQAGIVMQCNIKKLHVLERANYLH